MQETGTFPIGVINEAGEPCRDFTLDERTFRHTLELANDRTIKKEKLSDPAYYDAAIISKRLKIAGVTTVTPEMVLDLDGDDGDALASVMMQQDKRRSEFRGAKQAVPEAADSVA